MESENQVLSHLVYFSFIQWYKLSSIALDINSMNLVFITVNLPRFLLLFQIQHILKKKNQTATILNNRKLTELKTNRFMED